MEKFNLDTFGWVTGLAAIVASVGLALTSLYDLVMKRRRFGRRI